MAKSTTLRNDVLDHLFQNGASGTFTIGGTTYTLPLKAKFLTTVSTAGSAGTEMSGGAYPAGGVALNGKFGTVASAGSKSNDATITVTNAPAGNWKDVEIVDSTGTPKRMNFGGSDLAKTVNSGDTLTIAVGALTATET